MRSFKVRAQADRYRSKLLVEAGAGTVFDRESGLPVPWLEPERVVSWWGWSREWLGLKWPRWAGHSRRSGVEALAAFTPHLVKPRAPEPPAGLNRFLLEAGYRPGVVMDERDPCWRWLDRWSLPLDEVTPGVVERVLTLGTTKKDGSSNAASVVHRRRGILKASLGAAVRRGLLTANPMEAAEWRPPRKTMAVDVSLVPSPGEIRQMVNHVAGLRTAGAKYAGVFACVGLAGMRPSEALGLQVGDLELPVEGWGMAQLRKPTTAPGRRYTDDGEVHERKALKHRAEDETRPVPLPPFLVDRLRAHLDRFPPVEGRVFSTTAGRPVAPGNYTDVWTRARAVLWPAGHHLATATVYDLRHGAATMMLRAGVMPAEVARRLGHSVDVLNRVYAGVINGETEESNALIDRVLAA
jgi:integrase